MRKFSARWWVDAEFLERRLDHNIDTFEFLLGNYGLWEPDRPSTHCGPWTHPRPWDVSLRGPKTSIVFSSPKDFVRDFLRERMEQRCKDAIRAAQAMNEAQADYGRYIARDKANYFCWWPGL